MRTTAIVLIVSLLAISAEALSAEAAPAAKVEQESADWRRVADSVPLGSKVKVQMIDGKRISGTLMRVDSTALLVKRNARRPEPAVTIPFDQVGKLERTTEGGFSVGKAIAIGAGAGAGAMLTLILFALQIDD